jgi:hypothetical protein
MNEILALICSHWLAILLTFPLWGPLLMLALYAIWVQHERGGIFEVLQLVAFVGYPWDWLLQYTLAQVYFWEIAPRGESTISMRLGRLVSRTDWRGIWSRRLAWLLNWMSPKGVHVPMSS